MTNDEDSEEQSELGLHCLPRPIDLSEDLGSLWYNQYISKIFIFTLTSKHEIYIFLQLFNCKHDLKIQKHIEYSILLDQPMGMAEKGVTV